MGPVLPGIVPQGATFVSRCAVVSHQSRFTLDHFRISAYACLRLRIPGVGGGNPLFSSSFVNAQGLKGTLCSLCLLPHPSGVAFARMTDGPAACDCCLSLSLSLVVTGGGLCGCCGCCRGGSEWIPATTLGGKRVAVDVAHVVYKIVRHLPDRDAAALVMSSLKAKQRVSNKDLEKAEQKLIDAVIKHLAEMNSMLKPTQYEVAVVV